MITMEKTQIIHITLAGAIGALAAYFNILLIPLTVLIAVMIVDYFTGMASAKVTGELNSRIGIVGIIKKVGYLALIAVGMVVDYIIGSALINVGVEAQQSYWFGMIITIWLIINELISILENLGEIGVPMPEFLVRTVKTLKGRVDNEMNGRHFADEEISKDKEPENRRE